jgi:glycerol kinase
VPATSTDQVILAIDQGTTNSKAALISADGRLVASGTARVGVSSPPGWVEQDADGIWTGVLEAIANCLEGQPAWRRTRRGDRGHRALDSARVRGRLAG